MKNENNDDFGEVVREALSNYVGVSFDPAAASSMAQTVASSLPSYGGQLNTAYVNVTQDPHDPTVVHVVMSVPVNYVTMTFEIEPEEGSCRRRGGSYKTVRAFGWAYEPRAKRDPAIGFRTTQSGYRQSIDRA
jgi:hypothetical protein